MVVESSVVVNLCVFTIGVDVGFAAMKTMSCRSTKAYFSLENGDAKIGYNNLNVYE